MAARAMWKAALQIGDLKVPVKLYSALEDRDVHFRLLHAADHAPVKQRMVNPETDEPVANEAEQAVVPLAISREQFVGVVRGRANALDSKRVGSR